jgi:hypothetical protein
MGEKMPAWDDQMRRDPASFHPDPKKMQDPVEVMLEQRGPETAFDDLMEKLEKDPNDPETRRQANLLVNRLEDLSSRLRGKIQH